MNVLLVVMLAGLWIWLLSPGVLRDRRPRSPLASVDSFERFMDTLAPLSQEHPSPDGSARRLPRAQLAARRREFIFQRLAALTLLLLLVAALFGGWTWVLPAAAGSLLAVYTVALLAFKRRAQLRARVEHLPRRRAADAPRDATEDGQRRAREA